MPSVMNVDKLSASIDEWTDDREGAVFVVDEFTAFYRNTEEEAAEQAKEKGGECYDADGVRSVLIERVEQAQWQRCRVRDSGCFVIEEFEYEFIGSMAGILHKTGLTDRVPVAFGACQANFSARIVRESAREKWEGEIAVEAHQQDKLLGSSGEKVEFPIGIWEKYLFYTLPFRANVGPCTFRLVADGNYLAQQDGVIVDEKMVQQSLPGDGGMQPLPGDDDAQQN